ncbi:unnamed protein product [Calicophoron daubneyi]|uniref:Uncharacterized protein n=1 Tax=Calicophoron daubneyi TaxID=300641 RepID=A0AAV2TF92_CALDB
MQKIRNYIHDVREEQTGFDIAQRYHGFSILHPKSEFNRGAVGLLDFLPLSILSLTVSHSPSHMPVRQNLAGCSDHKEAY